MRRRQFTCGKGNFARAQLRSSAIVARCHCAQVQRRVLRPTQLSQIPRAIWPNQFPPRQQVWPNDTWDVRQLDGPAPSSTTHALNPSCLLPEWRFPPQLPWPMAIVFEDKCGRGQWWLRAMCAGGQLRPGRTRVRPVVAHCADLWANLYPWRGSVGQRHVEFASAGMDRRLQQVHSSTTPLGNVCARV